jgi:CHAT domain-containing protein
LMGDFYRLLWEQQKTPLAALREAQLNMLRRARSDQANSRGPELSHTARLDSRPGLSPQTDKRRIRDWAGFVLSGPGF